MAVDFDAINAVCPHCGNEGDSYNDGENFKREYYGHLGPGTVCLACKGGF